MKLEDFGLAIQIAKPLYHEAKNSEFVLSSEKEALDKMMKQEHFMALCKYNGVSIFEFVYFTDESIMMKFLLSEKYNTHFSSRSDVNSKTIIQRMEGESLHSLLNRSIDFVLESIIKKKLSAKDVLEDLQKLKENLEKVRESKSNSI